MIVGWRNYYGKVDEGSANSFLAKIDWYIFKRLKIFCRKKFDGSGAGSICSPNC